MIDEKNLNEEAEYYAKSVFRYYEAVHACKLGFTAGAEWAQKEFVNSLWHDASEKPYDYYYFLVKTKTGNIELCFYNNDVWSKLEIEEDKVTMWLDLRDILPQNID